MNDLAIIDTKAGYASTMDGRLWWTEDAGEHWQRVYDNGGKALNGFSLLSPSLGYLVGEGGTVLRISR